MPVVVQSRTQPEGPEWVRDREEEESVTTAVLSRLARDTADNRRCDPN